MNGYSDVTDVHSDSVGQFRKAIFTNMLCNRSFYFFSISVFLVLVIFVTYFSVSLFSTPFFCHKLSFHNIISISYC